MKKTWVVLACALAMNGAFAQASAPVAQKYEAQVQERIDALHAQLNITSAEESLWKPFADVMRENGETMRSLYHERMSDKERSAVDDMKQYAQITQAHADGIKKLLVTFEPLYNALSPEQKHIADAAFRQGNAVYRPGARRHTEKPAQPAQ